MNIFKFEVKGYSKSIIIWSLSIVAFLFLYMAFFPAMATDPTAFNSMMDAFPEEVLAIMGINPDLPMTSIMGFYSITMSFVLIPLAIQASFYGFSVLSIEERELTADFLLTKPVSRQTIFWSKWGASFIALSLTNIFLWLFSFLAFALFKGNDTPNMNHVLVFLSSIVFFQLFFLHVGMMISVILRKISSVISYSMALSFGLFILSSLGKMLSSSFLGLLSPFHHFDPGFMLVDGSYDLFPALLSVFIIITSFTLSYFLYLRRNIASL